MVFLASLLTLEILISPKRGRNTGFCRFLKYDFDDFRKQPIFTKLKFYDFIGIKKAALSELPF
jgi:hypothetical protein